MTMLGKKNQYWTTTAPHPAPRHGDALAHTKVLSVYGVSSWTPDGDKCQKIGKS